jgi:hypothetical protein
MMSASMRTRWHACLLATLLLAPACTQGKRSIEGNVSRMQRDEYIRDAVRMSSEGFVLEPVTNIDAIDKVRLTEIAQSMRTPAAICFLERAIETMEPGEVDGEQTWVGVPEGQAKLRARVSADGTVMATEVLESGFDDDEMEACLLTVIHKQRFIPSRDAFAYHVDVFYWVSLGFFRSAQTEEFATALRKAQTHAGMAAKQCLAGRVPPGEYPVRGLNLFDRDGATVVNRIERGALSPEIGACVASAFKAIHIAPEPEAFVRPAAPEVTFAVAADGSISVSDERWLALIELEEKAAREARKAELLDQPIGADAEQPDVMELPEESGASEPPPSEPPPRDEEPPLSDEPSKPGKLDLSPRRSR